MTRLILFGTFFVLLTNKRQLDAAREFYEQSSARIRNSNNNINQFKIRGTVEQQFKSLRARGGVSSTFTQSRRFHPDQYARDLRDLGQPSSFIYSVSSSYYYSYGGPGTNLGATSLEACRLTDNFCSRDYQCCSGKCRCVRWSTIGSVSCYKKCF